MNTCTKYIALYIKLLWTRLETNLNNKKKPKKQKNKKQNNDRETISEQNIELQFLSNSVYDNWLAHLKYLECIQKKLLFLKINFQKPIFPKDIN